MRPRSPQAASPTDATTPIRHEVVVRDTKIKPEALKYAGDTARALESTSLNQQPEDVPDVRVVLNSTRFWDSGDPPDGSALRLDTR